MQRQRWGVQEERSCGWPGPSLKQRNSRPCSSPCRGALAAWGQGLGPSLRSVEGQTLLSRAEGWGVGWRVSPPWASPRASSLGVQRLKEKGPWPWSLQSSRQEGESRPMPVGSGQRPQRGALNTRLSPSSNCGLSPLNNPCGVGVGALPSVLRIPDAAPNPLPTTSTLQPPEAGRRSTPGSQSASGGAGSGRWDPGLRLLGSCGSAPSCACACACAGAARYANCAGSHPGSATSRRAQRVVVREWVRATPLAGARGYERRRAAEVLGRHRVRPAPWWTMPGATGPCLFTGPPVPTLLLTPSPNRECPAKPRAAATFPRPVSEENFRPQPRWPPGPAPGPEPGLRSPQACLRSALDGRGSRSPGPPPGRRKVPASPMATLTGALIPSPAPGQSSCQGGGPSLISNAPQMARGVVPMMRAVRLPQCGKEGPSGHGVEPTATGHLTAELQLWLC